MSAENHNHPSDQAAIEAMHSRMMNQLDFQHERLNDELMLFQDKAYALGRARGIQEAGQWISVTERMPDSGDTVLAFYENALGNARRIRAEYIAAKTVEAEMFADPDTECVEYDEAKDTYYLLAGWYESIDNWDDYSRIAVNEGTVTHWLPMPAGPAHPIAAEQQP